MNTPKETRSRPVLTKVITWRIASVILTLIVMFLITGEIKSSTSITVMLHTVLTISHFAFEKAWERYEAS